jgi:hypothetical protein
VTITIGGHTKGASQEPRQIPSRMGKPERTGTQQDKGVYDMDVTIAVQHGRTTNTHNPKHGKVRKGHTIVIQQ